MTLTINSFDQLGDAIGEILRPMVEADFTNFFEETAMPYLAAVHSEYFSRSAGPSGPWDPWFFRALDAPPEHNTLVVSQRLAFSMQPNSGENILEMTSDELKYGTAVPYAGIHNFGATIQTSVPLISRDGKIFVPAGSTMVIPQREFVGLKDADWNLIVEWAADYVIGLAL